MSLIGEILEGVVSELLGPLIWRGCHAAGRRLIFLISLSWVQIRSLRHGGGGGWADFGAFVAGLLFWLAAAAGILWLIFR